MSEVDRVVVIMQFCVLREFLFCHFYVYMHEFMHFETIQTFHSNCIVVIVSFLNVLKTSFTYGSICG